MLFKIGRPLERGEQGPERGEVGGGGPNEIFKIQAKEEL